MALRRFAHPHPALSKSHSRVVDLCIPVCMHGHAHVCAPMHMHARDARVRKPIRPCTRAHEYGCFCFHAWRPCTCLCIHPSMHPIDWVSMQNATCYNICVINDTLVIARYLWLICYSISSQSMDGMPMPHINYDQHDSHNGILDIIITSTW